MLQIVAIPNHDNESHCFAEFGDYVDLLATLLVWQSLDQRDALVQESVQKYCLKLKDEQCGHSLWLRFLR